VLVVASALAVLALLAFAISLVAFLIQTSRHKPSTGIGLGHRSFSGTGAAIRHNLQRRLSAQKVRSTVAAMVEKARVDV
jgi:hypothetical protein